MKKILLSLFVMLNLFQNYGFAQKQIQLKIDSILFLLSKVKEDTIKVNILNSLSREIKNTGDYDKAKQYAADALSLSQKIKFKKGEAISYNNIGVIQEEQGNYPKALKFFLVSLKIQKELGDKGGIAASYNNIGNIYCDQRNYPEGLKNQFSALKIREEIGDKQGIATSHNNIGNIYYKQGNYLEGLKNYFASLKIKEEIGDKKGIIQSYNNIGAIYIENNNYSEALKSHIAALRISEEIEDKKGMADSYLYIGIIYYSQSNYSEALKNYLACLKIEEQRGDKQSISSAYSNIGLIYSEQYNYPEALKNHFASLKIAEEIGDKEGIAISYNNLGNIYIIQKKNSEASGYLNEGLSLAKEIGSIEDIIEGFKSLEILDSAQGNFKQALEHYKSYITYRDSLFNEKNTKKLVQSQMQYDFDKKEALTKAEQEKKDVIAIKEMQKQKLVRNGFMGGFGVVMLFAGVFFTQRNKIKKGKKLSDELLLNILPSEVAEELKQKGSAEAKQYDDVTVMFTDFKDFTQISEKLSPSELVAEIHTCFKAFDNIMDKYGIEKIKTIGDSYMAAGGLPVPNKTHADDVMKTALEIQKFMEGHFKSSPLGSFGGIRIGIHTGPVVAGIVGVKKFAYDIWGDTVNIASRMESSCEAGKINISGSTYELVKNKFNCIHRGKIQAKNKGEIDMYFVESVS